MRIFMIMIGSLMITETAYAAWPTCSDVSSCAEAKKLLKQGHKKLDRDNDGVPCESICGGG